MFFWGEVLRINVWQLLWQMQTLLLEQSTGRCGLFWYRDSRSRPLSLRLSPESDALLKNLMCRCRTDGTQWYTGGRHSYTVHFTYYHNFSVFCEKPF